MLPYEEPVELCHAQYWVPSPMLLYPCAVAMTYCALSLPLAVVFPKCEAARTASAANCDCLGLDGAALALSYQYSTKMNDGSPAGVLEVLQNTVPLATLWQY